VVCVGSGLAFTYIFNRVLILSHLELTQLVKMKMVTFIGTFTGPIYIWKHPRKNLKRKLSKNRAEERGVARGNLRLRTHRIPKETGRNRAEFGNWSVRRWKNGMSWWMT
jgi:hypothetical protein